MLLVPFLVTAVLVQQAAEPSKPEVPALKAGLGTCAADFVVKDGDGKPVYQAMIHAKIRYGAFSVKRMDVTGHSTGHPPDRYRTRLGKRAKNRPAIEAV